MVLAIFQIGSLVFCAKKLWFFGFGAHHGLWIFCFKVFDIQYSLKTLLVFLDMASDVVFYFEWP